VENLKYSLVAVSGGSDSMALLDMLYCKNKNLIVCHVNYNVRESALRDENIVRRYCEKRNIKLEVLKGFEYDKNEGNFENWARVIRYNFFKEMYKKYDCECLYVGHNLDDLLETYFIQKERKSKCDYYGLREDNFIYEMHVKRVLLNYSKEELRIYCENNEIEYGVDETNFDETYLRNNIRHNIVGNMSKEEKLKVVEEINFLNIDKEKDYQYIHDLLEKCKIGNNIIDLGLFKNNSEEDKIGILYYFIIENVRKRISIRKVRLINLINSIESSKPNIALALFEEFLLSKEYDKLVIKEKEEEFSYIIENLNSDIGKFVICKEGRKLEKVVVSQDLFPLKLESYKGDDKIINRLFIDKKIPLSERKRWPILKDKLGRVLLVLNIKKFYNIIDSNCDNMIEFYIRRKEEEKC